MSTTSNETTSPRRFCQIVRLKPESLVEYKIIHEAVWPAILNNLKAHHIYDYSIHYDPLNSLLIANFKYNGNNWESDSADIGNDPEMRRWWKITEQMQDCLLQGGSEGSHTEKGWWLPLEEVFRFEG